jgi:hypothetical protein
VNNTPTLPPVADRFSQLLLLLIQALIAQAGIKLPAAMVAMIEARILGIGRDFARLAASVEKGESLPSRRERRTSGQAAPRPQKARKALAPRGQRATARAPGPAAPLLQIRRPGPRATTGPPIFGPSEARALARPKRYDIVITVQATSNRLKST